MTNPATNITSRDIAVKTTSATKVANIQPTNAVTRPISIDKSEVFIFYHFLLIM